MKIKNVIGIIAFLSIFSVLFTLTTYLLRPEDDQAKESVAGFYAEDNNSLDVVYYGGSACYRYVIPPLIWKKYGVTSYVFGTAAQPFETTPTLLNETLKSQHPSLFVVEIRNLIIDDVDRKNNQVNKLALEHYMRLVTDNLLLSYDRLKLIHDEVKSDDKTDWYFDIIKNHSNWKNLGLHSLDLMLYNKKSSVKGTRTVGLFQKQPEFYTASYAGKITALDSQSEKNLMNVLNYCKKNKIKIMFVSTPYVENKLTITEENYVADIIKRYGFNYLNMNYEYNQIGINYSTDFYNDRHVNTLGATKVTNCLTKYITDHYTIKHSHTNSTTAEWDSAYKNWTALAQGQEEAVTAAIKRNNS